MCRYVRPRDQLDFTPMPDCFHELVGHAPIVLNTEMRMLHEAFGTALVRRIDSLRLPVFICRVYGLLEHEGPYKNCILPR